MTTSAAPQVPGYARSKLEEIVWDQGFVGGSYRMEFEAGSKAGDGFIGQVVRVRVQGDRLVDCGKTLKQNQTLSLICKFPFEDAVQREQFNSLTLFRREVLVYNEILPEMEKLQLARGLWRGDEVGFWNYPRCYWAECDEESGESMLIMEDLVEGRGLELKDKYVPVDYDHVEVLMVALGKLNACSFALKEQKPEVFEKIRKLDDLLSTVMMTEQTKFLAPRNCTLAASIFEGEKEQHLKKKFLSLKDCLWEKASKQITPEALEPYGALNHGDCWVNNVMFGYDKPSGAVNEIVLLDWQMARYSSPVLDLLCFIFLCSELTLRRERFPQLLNTFHNSFTKTFRKLGGNPEKSFPFEVIEQQMKRFGAQTLAMGTFAMPNLSQLGSDFFEDDSNRFKEEFKPQFERYRQLMRELVKDTENFDDFE